MKLDHSWCPDRPPIERAARLILHDRLPEMRFDLVTPEDVRRALSEFLPGHVLPGVLHDREAMLRDEMKRVAVVLDQLRDLIGIVSLELALMS